MRSTTPFPIADLPDWKRRHGVTGTVRLVRADWQAGVGYFAVDDDPAAAPDSDERHPVGVTLDAGGAGGGWDDE